jgi:hypothetical protein
VPVFQQLTIGNLLAGTIARRINTPFGQGEELVGSLASVEFFDFDVPMWEGSPFLHRGDQCRVPLEATMRRDYSVINELYGVEAVHQRARQGGLGLVIVMLLAGMFLYESLHPVMRLRSEPPSAFLKSKATKTAASNQEPLARPYWSMAANFVSEKYSYGELLPSRPPEDFVAAMGGDYATSSVYWQRLCGLWNQPENWVQSYQLDTGWINSVVGSASKVVKNYINS